MGRWTTETWEGSVAGFHAMTPPARRTVWHVPVTGTALVLGSSQHADGIDTTLAAARGTEIVRRRSGGGAVWLSGAAAWIDIVIPADDPLWVDDIPRSMLWLGDVFAGVIGGDARVWSSPYVATDLARAYCFAGSAPGEVVGAHGKIVGISQRRTRDLARFQCVAYADYDAAHVAGFFHDRALADRIARVPVQTVPVAAVDLHARIAAALPA